MAAMLKSIVQWLVALAIAVVIAAFLGTAAQGQFALESLSAAVGPLGWQDRLSVLTADLQAFAPRYAMLIAAASCIPYLLATLGARIAPRLATVWFVVAGGLGVLAVVLGLQFAFGQPVLKGAEGPLPLTVQALAGGLGGLAMARLHRLKRA